jgi:phosphate transport system substrate-binding protein
MNRAGNFIEPTLASFSAAADAEMPSDTRVMITNSPNPEAYPITSFTWIILYKEQAYSNRTIDVAQATVNTIRWLTGADAQAIATSVNYAPLPQQAAAKADAILREVTYEGHTILK